MKNKNEMMLKINSERQELNDLVIRVKLDKEKNKSLIKKKRREIARLLTQANAKSEEENAG